MTREADQVEILVNQSPQAPDREAAATELWPVVALGNMGPVWTDLSSFQEKLDILNQLSQR